MRLNLSLEGKIYAGVALATILATLLLMLFSHWQIDNTVKYSLALLLSLVFALCFVKLFVGDISKRLSALQSGMQTFKDRDFSISIRNTQQDELGQLINIYNEVGEILRRERQHIHQRELLLDTVIQHSALCLVLTDSKGKIIYANNSARQIFNAGAPIIGLQLSGLLATVTESLRQVINERKDCLFSMAADNEQQVYYLSNGCFTLNARQHHLYLIKQMTRELNRQEIGIWKKVIKLISHELNNSLAPISSVAHSGKLMLEKHKYEQLSQVFDSIADRAKHLKTFIDEYAQLAKLPLPKKRQVAWQPFITKLQTGLQFQYNSKIPANPGHFDPIQIEQVLLNLIKNAQESGSSTEAVAMRITESNRQHFIEITDAGPGMSEQLLQNALLPFYSTKTSGSGIGLPLCREIIEAHDGKMKFTNLEKGGLQVTVMLPCS